MKKISDIDPKLKKAPKQTLANQYEMAFKIQSANKHILAKHDGTVYGWMLPIMEKNGELRVDKYFEPSAKKKDYVQTIIYYKEDGTPIYAKKPIYKIETYESPKGKGSFKYLKECDIEDKPTYNKGQWQEEIGL